MNLNHKLGITLLAGVAVFTSANRTTRGAEYNVRHGFSTDLKAKEKLRGQWAYELKGKAVSKTGSASKTEKETIGPFEDDTSESKSLTVTAGGLATATANASMGFSQTGGFHQVDGVAEVSGDGVYARAYSSSALGLNTGIVNGKGKVKWKPDWKVDRINGSRRAGRDPVEIIITDKATGTELRDKLFDLQFDIGAGGEAGWRNGRLTMDGIDGMFSVNIESPYLTTKQGSMFLEFDGLGKVTKSRDSGIFSGLLPTVGQAARMDLNISDHIGDAEGVIDLDFDFGMEGDLDLQANLTANGLAQVKANSSETIHDFSVLTHPETRRLLLGTPFVTSHPFSAVDLVRSEPDSDPYAGYLNLAMPRPDGAMQAVAFDATANEGATRVDAKFDFQIENEPHLVGRSDGLSFLLLPTDRFGSAGPIDEFLLPHFSAANTGLPNALGVGLQILGEAENEVALVSVTWDGQQVAQANLPVEALGLGASENDWRNAAVQVENVDNGALLTVSLGDVDQERSLSVIDHVFVPGLSFAQGVRPAFATRANGQFATRAIDNLFVGYGLSGPIGIPGDFNGNGVLDATDINDLVNASAGNVVVPTFDLNQDGGVNLQDIAVWVKGLRMTWFGDANLDGVFDSGDFVAVFTHGKFEQDIAANWTDGDWNGDGRFNSGDMVLAFQEGGYEVSSTQTVAAVPEPTGVSSVLAIAVGLLVAGRARNRD